MKDGATLLNDFLERKRLSREKFAELVEARGPSVGRWINRRRVPSVRQAIKIERATGRAVPVGAWGLVERVTS